jgi:predicted DCC family thiol-disulfide oxidoreductase YuxK
MRLVKALDRWNRLEVAPFQDEAALAHAGLTLEQGGSAAWLLLPDGTRYRGAAAAWAAIAVAMPVLGDVLLAFYHLPVVRPVQDAVYRWFVRNRGRLPAGPPYLSDDEQPSHE